MMKWPRSGFKCSRFRVWGCEEQQNSSQWHGHPTARYCWCGLLRPTEECAHFRFECSIAICADSCTCLEHAASVKSNATESYIEPILLHQMELGVGCFSMSMYNACSSHAPCDVSVFSSSLVGSSSVPDPLGNCQLHADRSTYSPRSWGTVIDMRDRTVCMA